eukprot:gene6067-5930_t
MEKLTIDRVHAAVHGLYGFVELADGDLRVFFKGMSGEVHTETVARKSGLDIDKHIFWQRVECGNPVTALAIGPEGFWSAVKS